MSSLGQTDSTTFVSKETWHSIIRVAAKFRATHAKKRGEKDETQKPFKASRNLIKNFPVLPEIKMGKILTNFWNSRDSLKYTYKHKCMCTVESLQNCATPASWIFFYKLVYYICLINFSILSPLSCWKTLSTVVQWLKKSNKNIKWNRNE